MMIKSFILKTRVFHKKTTKNYTVPICCGNGDKPSWSASKVSSQRPFLLKIAHILFLKEYKPLECSQSFGEHEYCNNK